MDLFNFQMALNIKGHCLKVILMDRESSFMVMAPSMKVTGKMEMLMDTECLLSWTYLDMKDIGIKVSIMVKEVIQLQVVPNILELGWLENIMELVLLSGLMEVFSRENGKIVENLETENSQE